MWTLKKGKKAIASKSSITAPNRKVLLLLKEFSDKKILYILFLIVIGRSIVHFGPEGAAHRESGGTHALLET